MSLQTVHHKFPHKQTLGARHVPGLLALGCVLVFALPVQSVFAQSSIDTTKRLNRLENEIQTLSRAVFRGEDPPPGSLNMGDSASQADLEIRLQQMEQELRDMRGQLEEATYKADSLEKELERVTSDMEMRLNALEGNSSSASGRQTGSAMGYSSRSASVTAGGRDSDMRQQAREQLNGGDYNWNSADARPKKADNTLGSYNQSSDDGSVSKRSGDAAAMYESAFALLKSNQYDAAEVEFQAFLDAHPEHVLAGNAKYWLGETFYVRGEFEDAARLFAEGYQQFPKGAKAADNLLKLGMSLSAMGQKEDACVALDQIDKENFSGAGPVMRRAAQEKTRIGCSA